MGTGEIIYLGVICMHVLTTLTWLTSPGASSSSSLALAHCPSCHLWLSSTCCCLPTLTGTHSPLPTAFSCAASPFAGRWLWAGHPTLLSILSMPIHHPHPRDAALYSACTPTRCCLFWQPFKKLFKDKTPKMQEIILKRKVPLPLI